MAKQNANPEPAQSSSDAYHLEEASANSGKFKQFTKKRGFKVGASIAGGVLALGAAFGIGIAAGQGFETDRGHFSQGQFGPGHEGDHGGGFNHQRPPHGQGDSDQGFQMPNGQQNQPTDPNAQTQQN